MVDVLSAEAVVDHLVQLRGRGRGPVQVEERINPKKNDYKSVRVSWSVGWSVCCNALKMHLFQSIVCEFVNVFVSVCLSALLFELLQMTVICKMYTYISCMKVFDLL